MCMRWDMNLKIIFFFILINKVEFVRVDLVLIFIFIEVIK